jgi:hypothetical protein
MGAMVALSALELVLARKVDAGKLTDGFADSILSETAETGDRLMSDIIDELVAEKKELLN